MDESEFIFPTMDPVCDRGRLLIEMAIALPDVTDKTAKTILLNYMAKVEQSLIMPSREGNVVAIDGGRLN